MDSNYVWDVCSYFMVHLEQHKPRLVLLGPKVEALPDSHPSKPRCLFELSSLFESVGNFVERKRLLIYTLRLWRDRGDDVEVALTLEFLSDANRLLGLREEGIQQAKEALEIYEQFNDTLGRAYVLCTLARLFYEDQRFDAAEEAASQSIDLFPERVDGSLICLCHRLLGLINSSKGEMEKAIDHFVAAFRIGSSLNLRGGQFWVHLNLAELFSNQGKFDDSYAHVEYAKSHVVDDMYLMGRAMHLQAKLWYRQGRVREARSEALYAIDAYEKVGAGMQDLGVCRDLLRSIEKEMEMITSGGSDFTGELPDTALLPTPIDLPFQA